MLSAVTQEPVARDAVNELGLCRAELLDLAGRRDALLTELEQERREAAAAQQRAEERACRDAMLLAQLKHEKNQLEEEGRAKKRRVSEVETKALQLQSEKQLLAAQCEELRGRLDQEAERLASDRQERSRLEDELRKQREELLGVQQSAKVAKAAMEVSAVPGHQEALEDRIAELEREAGMLRMALENAAPERELAARFRQQHALYEEEIRSSREMKTELVGLREKALHLEQEEAALRAALEARDKILRETEDDLRGASLRKRDLDAFATAAATIVAEATASGQGDPDAGASQQAVSAAGVTPLDLSLAWARVQMEMGRLKQHALEQQTEAERAAARERKVHSELLEARAALATAEEQNEALQMDLRRATEDLSAANARMSVLREALGRGAKGTGAASGTAAAQAAAVATENVESLRNELDSAKRLAADKESLLKSKERALLEARKSAEELRQQVSQLDEANARAVRLEKVNSQLLSSNRDLENRNQQLTLAAESGAAIPADFDSKLVKVLHLIRGPGDTAPAAAESSGALGGGAPSAGIDLEQLQAARQLERFKKATKKYVQEFREGIYGLLGWRVEMKGDGNKMRFHLTSKYMDGQELVFQLRPVEPGRPTAEFDLLLSPWGEQLQQDRQAMAYLEVYRSVPGFLAHVTADLVSQLTLTG